MSLRWLIGIVVLVLVVGGVVGFNLYRDQAIEDTFANRSQPAVTVSVSSVEESSRTPTIDTIGTLKASNGVELTVETAGIINAVNFSSNQQVNRGDVLLRLDDDVEAADLKAAQTRADLEQQSLRRAEQLRSRGVNTQAELDAASAAANAAKAEVQKARATLEQKKLLAPFDGTIGISQIDVGEYVTPGTAVASLQDLSTLNVDFTVPQQELSRLQIDQVVEVQLDTADIRLTGHISGIDPRVDPATRLASVRAELDNTEQRVSPGQFVRIRINLPEEKGVIAIPQTALVTSLYGDHVYVVKQPQDAGGQDAESSEGNDDRGTDGQDDSPNLVVEQRFVDVGRRFGDEVEISGGLEAGVRVVNAGQNRLSNGATVKVDNSVNPAAPNDAGQGDGPASSGDGKADGTGSENDDSGASS